jgi:ATP-dependent DNA helicase RecG
MGQKEISGQFRKVLRKLHKDQLIENSIPENPNHPAQKHQLTQVGRTFLKLLTDGKDQGTL